MSKCHCRFASTAPGFRYPILGNILIIDHFETSNITQIVQLNMN